MLETRKDSSMKTLRFFSLVVLATLELLAVPAWGATVRGKIVDEKTGGLLPARIYIRDASGKWYFPRSSGAGGSALPYQRTFGGNTRATEQHTTLSAHPFTVDLGPGRYEVSIERGKEFRVLSEVLTVGDEAVVEVAYKLRRWVNMAGRGWFSGDTHVHRDPAEIPNVQLAEDVNVVLPVVHWTTTDQIPPSLGPRNFKGEFGRGLIQADPTHVCYPMNSEYEIFTTGGSNHTSGAFVVAHHKRPFEVPVFPLKRVVDQARSEGALIDLEKHNWPWSMAVVPIIRPDLFELSNNHLWRTEFAVRKWAVPAPAYMGLPQGGLESEKDWALYGFRTYYALLNCGFRISPSAGTANGVHPVPLGFGRVYVHLESGFDFEKWMVGLRAGRSFVTTGPMLIADIQRELPGHSFRMKRGEVRQVRVRATLLSDDPVTSIEFVVNGEVASQVSFENDSQRSRIERSALSDRLALKGSGWVAVRCWSRLADGRIRFAHTAPFYFDVPGESPTPTRQEAEFLSLRTREEIQRSRGLLPAAAVAEYEESLRFYEGLKAVAR